MSISKADRTFCLSQYKKKKAIDMLGGKCVICQESNHHKLDFHHINGKEDKEDTIKYLKGGRWSNIVEEIKKCVLLCANCHYEYHYGQAKDKRRELLKVKLLEYKGKYSCSRCGYKGKNFSSLDFHHTGDKSHEISILTWNCKGKNRQLTDVIKRELDSCELICKNCHREEHFPKEKEEKYKDMINIIGERHVEKNKVNKEEILDLIRLGVGTNEIARRVGCAKSMVSYLRKKIECSKNEMKPNELHIENTFFVRQRGCIPADAAENNEECKNGLEMMNIAGILKSETLSQNDDNNTV